MEGLLYSFSSVNTDLNTGKPLAEQKVTSLKINPKFDPALFQMPARAGQ